MHNLVSLSTGINSLKATRIEIINGCDNSFGWRAEPHFSPSNENATRSVSELSQLHFKEKKQIGTLIPYLTENTYNSKCERHLWCVLVGEK